MLTMHPTMMATIAADHIRDMHEDAARDQRARMARSARRANRAANRAAAARRAGNLAVAAARPRTAGCELAERHA